VVADHGHPVSLIGTIEDDMTKEPAGLLREGVRVYERAGVPNYPAPNAEGYPARVDVSRRLALFSASLPDHYETFRPKLDGPNEPTVAGAAPGSFVANERYKSSPGAMLRLGNLPASVNSDVHSGEDVILTATGPGSDLARGQIENTEVFRIIAEALGLGRASDHAAR
jgi:alkaline phosphatase